MELLKNRRLLIYDFEVYSKANFWCVVVTDRDSLQTVVIKNDINQLESFHKLHQDDIWIGYNSNNYDMYILKGILLGMSPFEINDSLIIEKKRGFQIVKNAKKINLNSYDVSNKFHSLKQIEGFMGSKIKESSIPFDYEGELNESQITEIVDYCKHDVSETLKIFNYKISDFDSQVLLMEEFEMDIENIQRTKTQLSSEILGAVKQSTTDDEFDLSVPEMLDLPDKYKPVLNYYMNPANWNYKQPFKSTSEQHARSFTMNIAGVEHVFGYGGVHGAKLNYRKKGLFLHPDVGSLYPSLMIVFNYMSRKVKDPEKFKFIRDHRLVLKAVKDIKEGVYKLILNSTYGGMKDIKNALFDPLMANNVCIAGQLLIVDLISKLEDYCELVQSNTDGLFIYVEDEKNVTVIKNIAKEWEERTGLQLAWEEFDEIIQKDVNNYIVINHSTNDIITKGGYVKKLSPTDYDLPILNKAVKEYFINGTNVEDYINNENRLIEFQRIVKVGDKYSNAYHNGVELKEKVNRIFASKDDDDDGISKLKITKGEPTFEKVENTPDKCFIFNDDVTTELVPEKLDKEYYIEVAKKRISDFITPKEIKVSNVPDVLYSAYTNNSDLLGFFKECKSNGIQNKVLQTYIKCDCCSKYGKTNKILKAYELFNILNDKKRFTLKVMENKLTDKELNTLIKYSSIKEGQKTYTVNDLNSIMNELFDSIPNEHLPFTTIIESQFDKFGKAWYTDSNVSNDIVMILNWQNKIKPNITAYHINTGQIKNYKIDPLTFNILPLYDKDVVRIKQSGVIYGTNIVGKYPNGKNIIEPNYNKTYDTLLVYEVLDRQYNAKVKTIAENELEFILEGVS